MTTATHDPALIRLRNLREACDNLGLRWHHNNKAATLVDRISRFRDAQKEVGPAHDVLHAMPGEYRAALRVCCRDVPNAGKKVKRYIRELMERVANAESASSTL